MAQYQAAHEASRIKLMLVSIAIIMIGITFAVLPVSATTTDVNYPNVAVISSTTITLGPAQNGYIVKASLNPIGTYRLTVRGSDASGDQYGLTLFTTYVYAPYTMPDLIVPYPGPIQVQVTQSGGSSATLNTSLNHSTTSYPLQIPGIALLVAGAALILTRVYKVKLSVSPSMPVQ